MTIQNFIAQTNVYEVNLQMAYGFSPYRYIEIDEHLQKIFHNTDYFNGRVAVHLLEALPFIPKWVEKFDPRKPSPHDFLLFVQQIKSAPVPSSYDVLNLLPIIRYLHEQIVDQQRKIEMIDTAKQRLYQQNNLSIDEIKLLSEEEKILEKKSSYSFYLQVLRQTEAWKKLTSGQIEHQGLCLTEDSVQALIGITSTTVQEDTQLTNINENDADRSLVQPKTLIHSEYISEKESFEEYNHLVPRLNAERILMIRKDKELEIIVRPQKMMAP